MKKLIYGGLFLAIVGIGFVGCKKDNVIRNANNEQKNLNYQLDNIPVIKPTEGEEI